MTPEPSKEDLEIQSILEEARKHSRELPPHKQDQKNRLNSLIRVIEKQAEVRAEGESFVAEAVRQVEASDKLYRQQCQKINTLESEKSALEKEKASLQEQCRSWIKFHTEATIENCTLKEEITRLKSRNEELERDKDNLLHSVERLEEWRDDIQKRFDERYATPNEYEKSLVRKPLQDEIDRLKAENERLTDEHNLYASCLRCIAEPDRQSKYTPQQLAKHALRMEPLKP